MSLKCFDPAPPLLLKSLHITVSLSFVFSCVIFYFHLKNVVSGENGDPVVPPVMECRVDIAIARTKHQIMTSCKQDRVIPIRVQMPIRQVCIFFKCIFITSDTEQQYNTEKLPPSLEMSGFARCPVHRIGTPAKLESLYVLYS